jgi:hypothetical protein
MDHACAPINYKTPEIDKGLFELNIKTMQQFQTM